jgi:hypothetical protein
MAGGGAGYTRGGSQAAFLLAGACTGARGSASVPVAVS